MSEGIPRPDPGDALGIEARKAVHVVGSVTPTVTGRDVDSDIIAGIEEAKAAHLVGAGRDTVTVDTLDTEQPEQPEQPERVDAPEWPEPTGLNPVLLATTDPPPEGGTGSGLQAWRDYADLVGLAYTPDTHRDDLVDAVKAARHIAGA